MALVESIGKHKLIVEFEENKETFSFGVTVNAGSANEAKPFINGTAHFLEHMLFKGYKGTGHLKLTRIFEHLGIEINAFTTKTLIHFYIKGLSKNFDKAITPFLKTIFHPLFSQRSLDKEKEIIKEEILSYDDDYEELIYEEADKILFRNSAYANPIAGTLESVDSIQIQNLLHFHKQFIEDCPTYLSYTGSKNNLQKLKSTLEKSIFGTRSIESAPVLDPNSAGLAVNTHFDRVCSGGKQNPELNEDSVESSNGCLEIANETEVVKKVIAPTSHILWSYQIGKVDLEKRLQLSLFNYILGEGNNSKLFWGIRERLGLTYNLYSSITTFCGIATVQIYMNINPQKESKATREFDKLMKNLEKSITDRDLTSAKNQLETQLVMESYDSQAVMQAHSKDLITYGRIIKISEIKSIIEKIKKDDIKALAAQISSQKPLRVIYKGVN